MNLDMCIQSQTVCILKNGFTTLAEEWGVEVVDEIRESLRSILYLKETLKYFALKHAILNIKN